jgi:plasmid stabilization system protein ParE
MRYPIVVTPAAEEDLRSIYRYIRARAPKAAREWLKGARRAIKTLARFPERLHLAPEASAFSEPIRELLYGRGNRGTYRILFALLEDKVFVLHVRHGSRLPLEPEDK